MDCYHQRCTRFNRKQFFREGIDPIVHFTLIVCLFTLNKSKMYSWNNSIWILINSTKSTKFIQEMSVGH